jgi:hypothetical protein
MSEKKRALNNQSDKRQIKEEWKTPEVLDLSINEGTQNSTKGSGSFGDGGPAFTDYNS